MKFTYYTIIGKDLNLLKGHITNIKEYAGFNKLTCEKELLVIVYKNSKIPPAITDSILEYCKSEGIKTFIYDEPTTSFIDNLYACWNLGYEHSDDGYVFRGGSDQVFSKDSFVALYEQAEKLRKDGKKVILQANTIENSTRLREIGAISRHFSVDIGNNFENFNYPAFEEVNRSINKQVTEELVDISTALRVWGKPTALQTSIGVINRVDGCSWLMTKEEFKKFGPLPTLVNGITGDVLIHDSMQRAGYDELIVRDMITYHMVRGESMDKY